jgi:hypothetical protein
VREKYRRREIKEGRYRDRERVLYKERKRDRQKDRQRKQTVQSLFFLIDLLKLLS